MLGSCFNLVTVNDLLYTVLIYFYVKFVDCIL
jgi:hypothetical protein